MASPGSAWLLLSFSPFPVRHPVRSPCSGNGDQTDLNGGVVGVFVADEKGSLDGAAIGVDEVLPEYLLVDPVND